MSVNSFGDNKPGGEMDLNEFTLIFHFFENERNFLYIVSLTI